MKLYQDEWTQMDMVARHIPKGHWKEEVFSLIGPASAALNICSFIEKLISLESKGTGNVKAWEEEERVFLLAYPQTFKERLLLPLIRGKIHLEKRTCLDNILSKLTPFSII